MYVNIFQALHCLWWKSYSDICDLSVLQLCRIIQRQHHSNLISIKMSKVLFNNVYKCYRFEGRYSSLALEPAHKKAERFHFISLLQYSPDSFKYPLTDGGLKDIAIKLQSVMCNSVPSHLSYIIICEKKYMQTHHKDHLKVI